MLHDMNKQQDKHLRSIENFLCDESEDADVKENQIDSFFDGAFKWLIRHVIPVCAIALIINLAIMFTLPVETAMSQWFWLKDPLSFILAYIVVKAINHFRNSLKIHN